jgi:hypothetical protein
MKRTITAIAVGTILALSGSILPASATTTAKQANCTLDSLLARVTSNTEAKASASSERLHSEQNSKDVYMAGAKRAPIRGQ